MLANMTICVILFIEQVNIAYTAKYTLVHIV